MTYISDKRRAEIMTVITLFRALVKQCALGHPDNMPRLAPIMAQFDMALVEVLDGCTIPTGNKLLSRSKRAVNAILDPWIEANAAVPKVYLMAHHWLIAEIEAGRFVVNDGPFKTGYDEFARMIEDSEEDMANLSHPGLQRSAAKGVPKLAEAFNQRFGA